MDRLKFFTILLTSVLSLPLQLSATVKRWTGVVPGKWNAATNWNPEGVPAESDDVIFDNGFLGDDYVLLLPDTTTRLQSLVIAPARGHSIQLSIPASNRFLPALMLSSRGNSIVLDDGAILKNSSGLSSGQSIILGGKFQIRNGAVYIHNTRASHAGGLVAKLSTDPGTEKGVYEFDVPGGSYSLSLSNRNYGTLRLLATASDGTQTYNTTGSSVSHVRGNLEINRGVVCNLDLEKSLTVEGDFIQKGGVFNLATQANNISINMQGSVWQDSSAVITETSSGLPVIAFEGSSQQQVSMAGSCLNNVGFVINNPRGIYLQRHLNISYAIQFRSGKIQSSEPAMVQFNEQAVSSGASLQSFVDGPVLKAGQGDFEFPVGRQGDYAPLKITASASGKTDNCIVQYHHGNPQELFGAGSHAASIVRVSTLEYWTIRRTTAEAGKISLAVGPYSHATSLEKLVVTSWDATNNEWINCGNSGYSGVSSGTIISNTILPSGVFTIGSTVPDQNPLPVYFEDLSGIWTNDDLVLNWRSHNQTASDQFFIETSTDGIHYIREAAIEAVEDVETYNYRKKIRSGRILYCRVILSAAGVKMIQSQEVAVRKISSAFSVTLYPQPAAEVLHVDMVVPTSEMMALRIGDVFGRSRYKANLRLQAGKNQINVPLSTLGAGIYFLNVSCAKYGSGTYVFLKR